MKKVVDTTERVIQVICGALLVIMTLAMFYQIIARFILRISNVWTEETSRFACIWCVYLGTSVCCLRDSHIRVTILDSLLEKKPNIYRFLRFIRNMIQILFFGYLAKVGFDSLSVVARQLSPNMLIPMNYIWALMPIGCSLSVIYLLVASVDLFARKEVEIE